MSGSAYLAPKITIWTTQISDQNEHLTRDEFDRANQLISETDRRQFSSTRNSLRKILSGYLECKPGEIEFEYEKNGRPIITGNSVSFNVSHSGELALIAVTTSQIAIGIDIEKKDPPQLLEAIAVKKFSNQEQSRFFSEKNKQKKLDLFFHFWTRKEALLKANGEGIFSSISEINSVEDEIRFLEKDWLLRSFSPDPHFAACIAIEKTQPPAEIEFKNYP